jgi:hypothetical protein
MHGDAPTCMDNRETRPYSRFLTVLMQTKFMQFTLVNVLPTFSAVPGAKNPPQATVR